MELIPSSDLAAVFRLRLTKLLRRDLTGGTHRQHLLSCFGHVLGTFNPKTVPALAALGTARRYAADLETANDAVGKALLTLSLRFEYIVDPEFRLSLLEARSRSSMQLEFVRVVIRELTEKVVAIRVTAKTDERFAVRAAPLNL